MIPSDQHRRRRIDFCDLFRDRRYRFIYDGVFGRLDDLEFGNAPVLFDADFDQCRNLGA